MGKIVVALICLFLHTCTNLSLLSTNFWDSPRLYNDLIFTTDWYQLKLIMRSILWTYVWYFSQYALKGLGSQTGFSALYFSKKVKNQLQSLPVIFSFIRTSIFFRFAKIFSPKVIKGSILASDVWMSNPNLMFFADFWIFKLMEKYKDTPATERYFAKLLLVVRYTIGKRMVVWKECIQC